MFQASRNVRQIVLALVTLSASAKLARAQNTLHVPSQYPTIQAAINAAQTGDTVMLADGTYTGPGNRALVFGGRAITVASASGNRAACIIDCQSSGRFAAFGINDAAVVVSLTIKHGRAGSNNSGGAVRIDDGGSPTFNDCVFEDCTAAFFGGAVAAFNVTNLTFDRCMFRGNQAQSGGGVYVSGGAVTVTACNFDDNYGTSAGGGLRITGGGRLTCSDSSFTANRAWVGGAGLFVQSIHPDSTVKGCVFRSNEAGLSGDGAGGGFACDTGAGLRELSNCIIEGNIAHAAAGALFRGASTTRVERVLFLNNQATDSPALSFVSDGGGARIEANNSPHLVSCTFIGNSATYGGGAEISGTPTLTNCLFAGNHASGLLENHPASGALDVWGPAAAPIVTNCTFAGNRSDEIGGATTVADNAQLQLVNCVMWGNSAPIGPGIRIGWGPANPGGVVTVSYSDIAGGQTGVDILIGTLNWGAGNIEADPLFVDPDGPDNVSGTVDDDFRLRNASPCIDAGDPAFEPAPCEHDLDGACRVWDGNADSSARVDMGAYEFHAARGDLNGDCEVGLGDLAALLAHFGTADGATYPDGDLDADGDVDLDDLTTLLANFGSTCP